MKKLTFKKSKKLALFGLETSVPYIQLVQLQILTSPPRTNLPRPMASEAGGSVTKQAYKQPLDGAAGHRHIYQILCANPYVAVRLLTDPV